MFRGITRKGWVSLAPIIVAVGVFFTLAAGRASGMNVAMPTDPASLSNPLAPSQSTFMADTSSWPVANGSMDGVSYTFSYPPNWNSSLIYCIPGAANNRAEGGHLPSGCASTDILVGPKARDTGLIPGNAITIDGKSARKLVDLRPSNVLVSRVYTTMVYSASGAPLFGFTTQIGAGTSKATLDSITSTLDVMAGTIRVEMTR